MTQYFLVLYEIVSFNESSVRKCMIVHWRDLIGKDLNDHFSGVVGAALIVIPEKLDALPPTEKHNFIVLEQKFANIKTDLSIYFAPISLFLKSLLKNVASTSLKSPTAFQQMINSFSADKYQISSSNTATSNAASAKAYNIIGRLNAHEQGKPYIFIVAYYDSHAIAPGLAFGSDSNGSGVAALLEILQVLSKLFASQKNERYNVVFALTTSGKFSYQGSRSFIDDFNEKHTDDTVQIAICLDGIGRGNILHTHVSKTLSEGSPSFKFYQHLKSFSPESNKVDVVPKKINLSSEKLAWEHEIYNIRHIHALTLSHFSNYSDPLRSSLMDLKSSLNIDILKRNTELIANALVSFIFDVESTPAKGHKECSLLKNWISKDRLLAYIDVFGSKPRPMALSMTNYVSNLHEIVRRYAHQSYLAEVHINDFVFFNILEDKLVVNVVKPAIFDLLLASAIGVYLFCFYQFATHAQAIILWLIPKIKGRS